VKRYWKRFVELVIVLRHDPFKWARLKLTILYSFIIIIVLIIFLGLLDREFNRNTYLIAQEIPDQVRRERFIKRSARVRQGVILKIGPDDISISLVTLVTSYILAGIALHPLKKSMQIQKQFLENASHELRTPLTIIKTELEVFLRDKNNWIKSKRFLLRKRTAILSNLEEVDKMQQMIDNLLFLSREESHEESFYFTKVNFSSLLSVILERINKVAKRKRISLYLKSSDKISIFADSIRLEQAILNIVTNSIKYTKEGGKVSILAEKNDEYIIISITDNGIGISNEDLAHIFDRFYRVKSVEVSKAKGVGLGLHIASVIIKRHGGKIDVKSTLGKGTTVQITLPLNRVS